ncbi:bifunctional 5,10-methylenetetrahydrofolate dehydrogenase/5,10-methenyltetrahydrofolate cyclohydrolase [Candidatus Viridilinea mediisalina]|uniref:Bifunctional protein FolD n=1 Tax=Candidatus Viridilinea mediisalina TaxID=2024553 RepID=A0A2A6RGP8_9CHLR|nr:bifunctional 5,10-methylenetetrahydrofolate dehydrogenase/5,10-methenyltetrahydrofolate cyclohydrolase [Candidatus Viridilinea mediisalina]PDW02113.1 bifunctional 5,10-methylene-tetrahydrofolate dehydrogenase/5,10-methylene-tetrahydrofolate cyclohydrolase [Candidatus Viridilinea mediisalina]
MPATMLDGRALAQELRQEAEAAIVELTAKLTRAPSLVVVQVGDDPASTRYVRTIGRLCKNVGVTFQLELLPNDAPQADLIGTLTHLNQQPDVDGILIQMPLPGHLDATSAILALDHRKDVDGVHPINAGLLAQGQPAIVPNTPAGGMELLRRNGITLRGKRAAVVGRSAIVGRPMAQLLVQADATVTICHSRTNDLGSVLRECEIVCVAAGRPGLITAAMIKPGATVVDFGTNVCDDGSLVGDVDFASVAEIAAAITPVPGGTGPVTNMMLLKNLVTAASARLKA